MGAHVRGINGRRRPHLQLLVVANDRLSLDLPDLSGAACRREDPEVFFSEAASQVAYAKSVCGRCPVRAACLARALGFREEHGVFGGLTAGERRGLRRRQRQGAAA
jgi:WhiB family redox-sensing transcriptional regulator